MYNPLHESEIREFQRIDTEELERLIRLEENKRRKEIVISVFALQIRLPLFTAPSP